MWCAIASAHSTVWKLDVPHTNNEWLDMPFQLQCQLLIWQGLHNQAFKERTSGVMRFCKQFD